MVSSRVLVGFKSQIHYFRATPTSTFASLLEDTTRHWSVDASEYELQDDDGCVWPSQALVLAELSDEGKESDYQLDKPSMPQILLRPLNSCSDSQIGSLIGNVEMSEYLHGGSGFPPSNPSASTPPVHFEPLSIDPLSKPPSSVQSNYALRMARYIRQHSSEAVRKLIEENRISVFNKNKRSVVSLATHNPAAALYYNTVSAAITANNTPSLPSLAVVADASDSATCPVGGVPALVASSGANPLHKQLASGGTAGPGVPSVFHLDNPAHMAAPLRASETSSLMPSHLYDHRSAIVTESAGAVPEASYAETPSGALAGAARPGDGGPETRGSLRQTWAAGSASTFQPMPPRRPSMEDANGGDSDLTLSQRLNQLGIDDVSSKDAIVAAAESPQVVPTGYATSLSDSINAFHWPSDPADASSVEQAEKTEEASAECGDGGRPAATLAAADDGSSVVSSVNELKWVASNAIPRSGIRLLKGYDHVMVDEHLSDKQIELAPTTIKLIRLVWESPPQNVMIIKKQNVPDITALMRQMADWLTFEKNVRVIVEPSVLDDLPHLTSYKVLVDDASRLADVIDLIICLGGDGTVLHVNYLFQAAIPPVMAFNLGSLGFLTPFRIKHYKRAVSNVMRQCNLTLRSRLLCIVCRQLAEGESVERHTVLNEVVIERGNSPYISNLACYCDGHRFTTIQADGIIISTTTGSTAYSLAAGGSVVHPQVPAIIFTPICPHSLSFRPLLFPDSVELKVQLPHDSRSSAWASFDGRSRIELERGDYLIIRVSKWPFVWVNKSDTVDDWFNSLADCLNWNARTKQKAFLGT